MDFPNPIGLAAGCDKDGRVPDAMLNLGFGFVEIGTVTPRPQTGNPKPRLFRLEEDRAVINRMGFNSDGLDTVVRRLSRRTRRGIVGINLGKNRDTETRLEITRRASFAPAKSPITLSLTSPRQTPPACVISRPARHSTRCCDSSSMHATRPDSRTPLLLKIAPDLTEDQRCDIAEVALATGIDGLLSSQHDR